MQCVENCSDPDPSKHVLYEQPVWQTLQMFLGEMLCFLPVIYTWLATRNKRPLSPVRLEDDDNQLAPLTAKDDDDKPQQLHGWKVFLLWIPAACDLTGTTLMNIGLLYTPVSIYQMTRGALVLFVGVFSVIFLRRRLWLYQWISLLIVMSGVALVGYSGSLVKHVVQEAIPPPALRSLAARAAMPTVKASESENVSTVLLGVFFVLFAQIFTATQFVVEEKIMGKYAVSPLVAVGYEGLFGAISILLLFPILSIPSVAAKSPFFDLARGWRQMVTTPSVMWSGVAIAISISLFNFFGLSVTRHVSATARSLVDTCRTLAIWLISLGLGWEVFVVPTSFLQVMGFALLVYGTFLFNNLVRAPPCIPMPAPEAIAAPPSGTAGPSSARARDEEEREGLLSSTLDETAALPADLGQGGYDVVPEGQHAALAVAKSSSGRD
ncbi:integral membrane protein, variant 4 [Coprinopsis cinerea AmutBmut pab1-1]|nr:integral membrane protein, variant 4 [Coprinopsis cinerea AmutBmut pab1-1]